MIHEVLFSNGTATYINRFVETKGLALAIEKRGLDMDWVCVVAGSL
ncbi:MAG: carotenoid cleavage dioxygenase-like enzyme [Limisphaerales bacterium]|jgi:carotenoid cleavage dioxygenase-like enzyme